MLFFSYGKIKGKKENENKSDFFFDGETGA